MPQRRGSLDALSLPSVSKYAVRTSDMLIFTTLLELFFVILWTMLLSAWAARRGAWCRSAVTLLMLFLAFILGSQLSSIYSTGHYVDVLTLAI